MNTGKNKKPERLITVVIAGIILVLAALIAIQIIGRKSQNGAAQSRPGEIPAAGGPGAPGGQSGQAGARSGGQGVRNAQGGAGNAGGPPGAGREGGQASGQGAGRNAGRGGGSGAPARAASAVRARRVDLGAVENSVVLGGEVLAASEVPVYPVVGGKLTELRVNIGDRVQRGQIIATVDPSKPGDRYFTSPVTAAVSGTVISTPVSAGDTVQTGTAVCVIGDISRLRLETFVPERFSVNMRIGLPAQVNFQAIPGENFRAEIDEMSPVLDTASRTRRIMLRFTDQAGKPEADPRIMAGMFATLSLVTNSRSGVPVIPRQSLINTYGSWIVYVIEDEGGAAAAKRREIELGLESEDMVEIVSGLAAGERIVIEGQTFLSDGDPVRILE